jgi:hypothetical protein
MKTTASKELMSRLTNASLNGSAIAWAILEELKRKADVSDIIRGHANFFSTKRIKETCPGYQKVRIVFTACTKDITNSNFPDRNNPQARWFPENRVDMDASTFIGCFKNLPDFRDEEIEYFNNSICVNSKITVKLYDKMIDFYNAYLGVNYINTAQTGESSLHNSCMRSEETARNAADFYYNFAGAKIIVAKDSEENILGRAIVWEHVNCMKENDDSHIVISVLDRVYYSHTFIMKIIYDYAGSIGIHLRKKHNTNSNYIYFTALNDIGKLNLSAGCEFIDGSLKIKVPATKWHKRGAPYMDTFFAVCLSPQDGIFLANTEDDDHCFAKCRDANGYACRSRNICPACGSIHVSGDLCSDCTRKYTIETPVGTIFPGKAKKYGKDIFPGCFFENGRPNKNLKLYLQVKKLYNN